jgi:cytoskeletal protein RodZ
MDTPGNVLRAERERQKKSLKEIAKRLKINIQYIKAIEEDDYSLLPAEVFTKAYLRIYAEALELESEYILSLYKGESEAFIAEEPVSSGKKSIFTYRPVLIIAVLVFIVLSVILFTNHKEQKSVKGFVNKIQKPETVEEKKPGILTLKITAIELTWISVSMDDAKPKEWLLRSGGTVTVTAMEKFVIKIGNAGGTRLTLNDDDLGELGPHGKVVDIVLP